MFDDSQMEKLQEEIKALEAEIKTETPHLTDLGNARRFVQRYGKEFRYVPAWGWLYFDGKRWAKDEQLRRFQAAQETITNLHFLSLLLEDPDERQKFIKHALRCESDFKIKSMLLAGDT